MLNKNGVNHLLHKTDLSLSLFKGIGSSNLQSQDMRLDKNNGM